MDEEQKVITGTTESGFDFEVSVDALDDYEFLKILAKIDNGDKSLLPLIIEKLLGADGEEKLKNHVSKISGGKVKASDMFKEISDIFSKLKDIKTVKN